MSEDWDLIIKPKRSWWDIGLKDAWEYRDLLFLLVRRDIVATYKQTVLGPLWFFIQPLFTTTVFLFVFGKLAGLSTLDLPGPIFYLSGITFWTYFAQTLTRTANTLKENEGIFGKVYFPRIIMPISVLFSNLLRLIIQLFLLLVIVIYFQISSEYEYVFSWRLILFPLFLFLLAIQALGFGLMVTALTTKYRDLVLLLTFGVQLLMYASPVVYPLESLRSAGLVFDAVSFNPVSYILEGLRYALFGAGYFSLDSVLFASGSTILIVLLGIVVFNRVERNFVDTI